MINKTQVALRMHSYQPEYSCQSASMLVRLLSVMLLILVSGVIVVLLSPCYHLSLMVWPVVQGVLLPHEVQLLMNHEHHKPNFVLAVLTQVIDNLPTSDARKQAMDASLTSFHQAVGSCERMIKTPIPRSYTRFVLGHSPPCGFP